MRTEIINIAFALSNDNKFENKHFGDSDKFGVYELNTKTFEFNLVEDYINEFKTIDETHGSSKKGNTIVKALKEKGCKVLVSMQFGANIKIISKHFQTLIVYDEDLNTAIEAILTNTDFIAVQFEEEKDSFKPMTIKDGKIIQTKE